MTVLLDYNYVLHLFHHTSPLKLCYKLPLICGKYVTFILHFMPNALCHLLLMTCRKCLNYQFFTSVLPSHLPFQRQALHNVSLRRCLWISLWTSCSNWSSFHTVHLLSFRTITGNRGSLILSLARSSLVAETESRSFYTDVFARQTIFCNCQALRAMNVLAMRQSAGTKETELHVMFACEFKCSF